MAKINKKLLKNCISSNKRVIDVLNIFENTGINLALVIDSKQKLTGLISASDVRRGLIKGLDKKSKIDKIINYKPLYLRDQIDENQLSNIISSPKFNNINPPYIPIVNKDNIPREIIDKQNLNLRFLYNKRKEKTFKPRIVLLGGAGYIGTVLAEKLLKLNFKVTIFDKFVYLSKQKLKSKIK